MDWDDYEIYSPGVFDPLNTLPRSEARKAYERCMEQKPARIEALRELLMTNGVQLTTSDAGIQDLNDWFVANVQPDPVKAGRLTPEWYSVVHDVALFLGDVMIERCPELRWEFYTWGKKNVAYQQHVIMGFTQVSKLNQHDNINVNQAVATYGHRLVASGGSVPNYGKLEVRGTEIDVDAVVVSRPAHSIESDAFWRWVRLAESKV